MLHSTEHIRSNSEYFFEFTANTHTDLECSEDDVSFDILNCEIYLKYLLNGSDSPLYCSLDKWLSCENTRAVYGKNKSHRQNKCRREEKKKSKRDREDIIMLSKAREKIVNVVERIPENSISIDLCSAPGGMTQYLYEIAHPTSKVISISKQFSPLTVDVFQRMASSDEKQFPSPKLIYFEADLLSESERSTLSKKMKEIYASSSRPTMGVLFINADGAVDNTDDKTILESDLNFDLIREEISVSLKLLSKGGNFMVKVFDIVSERYADLLWKTYQNFQRFVIFKPRGSKKTNSEKYILFINFNGNSNKCQSIFKKRRLVFCDFDGIDENGNGNKLNYYQLFDHTTENGGDVNAEVINLSSEDTEDEIISASKIRFCHWLFRCNDYILECQTTALKNEI